jgi:hypothetical protein
MNENIETKSLGVDNGRVIRAFGQKIEQAIRSTGATIKAAAIDREGAHPDLPTRAEYTKLPSKTGTKARTRDRRANFSQFF